MRNATLYVGATLIGVVVLMAVVGLFWTPFPPDAVGGTGSSRRVGHICWAPTVWAVTSPRG